jgi:predicted RNase H-like HicB family nuclease
MSYNFTAYFQQDGDYYIGFCPEVAGANGQGKTIDECRESLQEAVKMILDIQFEENLDQLGNDFIKEDLIISEA